MKNPMHLGGKNWAGMSSFQSALGETGVHNIYCSFTNSVRVNLHAISNGKMAIYSAFNIFIRR